MPKLTIWRGEGEERKIKRGRKYILLSKPPTSKLSSQSAPLWFNLK